MVAYFKQLVNSLEGNMTKIYLITANIVLVIFAIWFSNVEILPFKNFGDFAFFIILSLILALYRPGWTFLFFIGTLVLENINLAPVSFGLSLRPYQFFGFITIFALLVQFASKRIFFSLPKWGWYDALPIVFVLAGFISSLGAIDKSMSFKQSIIMLSFIALYFLTRIYVQSLEDLKRIAPFFLSSGLVATVYAIWQNVRFLQGANSFEVMAGRPNSTFTEPDWLGVFIVFLIAMMFVILYKLNVRITKKQETNIKQIQNSNNQSGKSFGVFVFGDWILLGACFLYLVICNMALILTVSRSAWVGAILVAIGFLKFVLYDGSWRFSNWQWKKMFVGFGNTMLALLLSIFIVYVFGLTKFQLASRAASTGGLQKITVSCQPDHAEIPKQIQSVDELAQYRCTHINLEDIDKEKLAGNVVLEINRPDPNVGIRAKIYRASISEVKKHPIFGIGWGSISSILGSDERGVGLNASNIFLEVWLGSGLLGILSFLILLVYIFIKGVVIFFKQNEELKTVSAFVLLGWTAVVVPNLFNSGIFLGFVWAYIAVAIGLLSANGDSKNI